MRKRLAFLALALAVPAVALVPMVAEAERPAKPKVAPAADAGDRYDPENVTAISEHLETLAKGNAKAVAKDYPAAIDLYKKAAQLKPKDASAPYLLGEAYLADGHLPEAEAALEQAEELADPKIALRDPRRGEDLLRAQILFVLATAYERQKKWELARTTWTGYSELAAKMKDGGGAHPDSAAARLQAIEDWLSLDQKYEIVRQRIAAEKDAGADAGKPPKK
jgi:tetratricopeptide (TPR) repeat protein